MTTRDMLLRIVLTLIPAVLLYALVRLEIHEEGCCACCECDRCIAELFDVMRSAGR